MKILMLAPEPFFQPRGTPISVYFRLKALSDLGHKVDLVTYHIGEPVRFKNLRIRRIPNLFFIRRVKIGPSLAKIPLDSLLFFKALWQLLSNRYDLIFSHEEAALLGCILAKFRRLPHLYDMHSSLPQQLENFQFTRSRIIIKAFLRMESFILKNSRSVIVICRDLLDKVAEEGWREKAVLLENFLDFDCPDFSREEVDRKRKEIAPHGRKIILYAGNFETYQGIPLLLEAAAELTEEAVFLLVGGNPADVEEMKKLAEALAVSEKVVFAGKVPPTLVPFYVFMADVLVSPRTSGTNTPLKIYSFLKTGKPMVATNLWTHTQVLNNDMAILTDPEPRSLAEGLRFALTDREAMLRAEKARKFAESEYTYSRYLKKISLALNKAIGKYQATEAP